MTKVRNISIKNTKCTLAFESNLEMQELTENELKNRFYSSTANKSSGFDNPSVHVALGMI